MKSIEPLVDLWWEDLDLMVSTRDQYWNSIHHCLKYLKSIGVSSTPRKKDLLSYKRALGELGYSATTQNNYITAMRRFFSWAHKSGHISFNPATEIRGIRLNDTFLKDSLTPEKGRELLHSIDPDECITSARDYAICSLMIRTGIRRYSAWAANVEDLRTVGNHDALQVLIKGAQDKSSYVILTPQSSFPIQHYLDMRGSPKPTEPLFTGHGRNNSGKRLSPNYISTLLKRRLKAIGLSSKRHSGHSLRHSAISYAAATGCTASEIMSFSHHRDPKMVFRYIHLLNRLSDPAEHSINKILD